MKIEQTERSETSSYKIQTPGNYPEQNIQHTELGESLKSVTKPKITRNSSLLFFENVQNCKESCDLNVKDQSEALSEPHQRYSFEEQLQPVVQTV
jgi:hypothetical protein